MKKLLVLMLVLGVSSLATAGLTFATGAATISVGEVYDLVINTTGGNSTNYVGYLASSVSVLTNLTPSQGNLSQVTDETSIGWGGYWQAILADSGGAIDAGEAFTGDMEGLSQGTYTIYILNDAWTALDTTADINTFVLTVIPEPITMGLLAVGGLFLRRRK